MIETVTVTFGPSKKLRRVHDWKHLFSALGLITRLVSVVRIALQILRTCRCYCQLVGNFAEGWILWLCQMSYSRSVRFRFVWTSVRTIMLAYMSYMYSWCGRVQISTITLIVQNDDHFVCFLISFNDTYQPIILLFIYLFVVLYS